MRRLLIMLLLTMVFAGTCFAAGCGGCSDGSHKIPVDVSEQSKEKHNTKDYNFP